MKRNSWKPERMDVQIGVTIVLSLLRHSDRTSSHICFWQIPPVIA